MNPNIHPELKKILKWKAGIPCCPFCSTIIPQVHCRGACLKCTRDFILRRDREEDDINECSFSLIISKTGPKVYIDVDFIKELASVRNDKSGILMTFSTKTFPFSNETAVREKIKAYLAFI